MVAIDFGQIAQSVEQRTENPCVASSILALAMSFLFQLTCNLKPLSSLIIACYNLI